MSLLEVRDLRVHFPVRGGRAVVRAVDGVSFSLERGEILGIVGESGCGKSTLGNAIVGLVPVTAGSIFYEGDLLDRMAGERRDSFRRGVQMVFQDPFGSLNPRIPVGSAMYEILKVHKFGMTEGLYPRSPSVLWRDRVAELFQIVGLDPAYGARYPHEFSGGQRQRIGIARALALNPSVVIADEPVSALDVSVQVQILNLMKDLQARWKLSYLFIAHDLAVVHYMCSRILVMYLGKVVESATASELFLHPSHPYTEALIAAVPDVDKGLQARKGQFVHHPLKGDVPSPTEKIPGCPFHPRCPRAVAKCREVEPELLPVADGHCSSCHFARDLHRG